MGSSCLGGHSISVHVSSYPGQFLPNVHATCHSTAMARPTLRRFEFGVAYLFPFCVICWCYYHVIRITLGRQPRGSGPAQRPARIALRRSRRRVTKTACLIMVAFIICWSPTFVLSIWRIASGTESVHHGHALYEVSFFGTLVNEAINPIIYSVYDRNMNVCAHIYCSRRVFNAAASEAESTGTRSNDTTNNRGSIKITRRLQFKEPS